MGKLFGTDGIRGVAGAPPLTRETIERIGYLLTRELTGQSGRPPHIITGRDTRQSGEWIESAIHSGVTAAAGRATSAGVITTPGVAFLTRALDADAGIVLSASHNSFEDNGIKVFAPSGQKLDEAMEEHIESSLFNDEVRYPDFPFVKVSSDHQLKERYLDFLVSEIAGDMRLNDMKIVLDCANGASYELAPRLFERLGAEMVVINAAPNGRNINLDCGSLHPEKLQRVVLESGSSAGFAFDGDADRLLMIGENGQLIDGDQILFIMANYLHAKNELKKNRIVATVMSNLGLELGLRAKNIDLIRTAVGDKNVLDELLNRGGSVGGEQSGHIIFPEISLAGDGLITALEVLRVMVETKMSLNQLLSGFTRFPQVIINVKVSDKPPLDTLPSVQAVISEVENELEGCGRVLVRYSGTELKARVMIEGPDEQSVATHAKKIADAIEKEIGVTEDQSTF